MRQVTVGKTKTAGGTGCMIPVNSPQDSSPFIGPLTTIGIALPVMFGIFLTLLLALEFFVVGYISYFAGMGLLWWGYAQLLMRETPAAAA